MTADRFDPKVTGIPDPAEYGDISKLPTGQVLPMGIQEHRARRAGLHRDIRIGKDQMFSWATKGKGLPGPGESQAQFQTPLHSEQYGMNFEGKLPKGIYGAGSVKHQEKGSVIIHKAEPNKILFTTSHTRYPQTYVGIRTGKKPTDWLFMNLTPKSLEEFAGPGVSPEKEHYNTAEPSDVEGLYNQKNTFSEKVDGARMLLKLRKHYVEAASYRPSVTGFPIMHTSRLQLPRDLDIPHRLLGSTLVAEAYGDREPEEKTAMAPAVQAGIVSKLRGLPAIQRGAVTHALKLQGPTGDRIRQNFTKSFMPNLQRAAPMPTGMTSPVAGAPVQTMLPKPAMGQGFMGKAGAYHKSRSKKKLLAALGQSTEPIDNKPGQSDSAMVTGSDAPRLEQGLKMGAVNPLAMEAVEQSPRLFGWLFGKKEEPEAKKPGLPAMIHPLPKVMANQADITRRAEMPAEESRGSPEPKVANAIGRVEPEVAKKVFMPNFKVKPMKPDTRPLLQDKAAAVKPGIGLFSRFMKRTHQHIQRVCDNASKLVKRYPGKYAGLIGQSRKHDKSKFSKGEMVPYIWLTEFHRHNNDGKKFEYPEGMKARVDKACLHHINSNRHHVEFHGGDGSKMTKIDIAEMVCDWAAMSQELGTSLREWSDKKIKTLKCTKPQVEMINEIIDFFEPAEKKAATSNWKDLAKAYYANVDAGHGLPHVYAVTHNAKYLAAKYYPEAPHVVSRAAFLHDIGNSVNREQHEIIGAQIAEKNPKLLAGLTDPQADQVLEAIRQHRSSTGNPQHIVGQIVSDADRMSDVRLTPEQASLHSLHRAILYGQHHHPELTDVQHVERAIRHIRKKYGDPTAPGRRVYFPETGDILAARDANMSELTKLPPEEIIERIKKQADAIPTQDPVRPLLQDKAAGFLHGTQFHNMDRVFNPDTHFIPLAMQLAARQRGDTAAATVKGVGQALIGQGSPLMRREGLAHELFHNSKSILSHWEPAAYFSGGYSAPRNAGVLSRILGGLKSTGKYLLNKEGAHAAPGYKTADAIPTQELGGILNSSLAESVRKQREQKVKMRLAIFNILSQGKKPVDSAVVPYNERIKMIQEILGHLPEEQFHLPEMADTPESKRKLFEAIQSGKNPRTHEGVVVWPETGVPTKIKFMPESDVTVRSIFPGEAKYEGVGAGGFEYSLPDSDKVVGKVGTGLSDELRTAMLKNPEAYIGRTARIKSMGQYPSGAHRAPGLIAMHEG